MTARLRRYLAPPVLVKLSLLMVLIEPAVDVHAKCEPSTLPLTWPVEGEIGKDWTTTNFFDLDSRSNFTLDYEGGQRTYDGHNAIDIVITSFRTMVQGVQVLAAAEGVVSQYEDGHSSRSLKSNRDRPPGEFERANYIAIYHENGMLTRYLHLRKDSALVRVGDRVRAGQPIGLIGSSGSSTWPHLHFEVLGCDGVAISSMENNMFLDPPPYQMPFVLQDLVIRAGNLPEDQTERKRIIIDEQPNLTAVAHGNDLVVGVLIAGGLPGDTLRVTLRYPNGRTYRTRSLGLNHLRAKSYYYWWWSLKPVAQEIDVVVFLNDAEARSERIKVIH